MGVTLYNNNPKPQDATTNLHTICLQNWPQTVQIPSKKREEWNGLPKETVHAPCLATYISRVSSTHACTHTHKQTHTHALCYQYHEDFNSPGVAACLSAVSEKTLVLRTLEVLGVDTAVAKPPPIPLCTFWNSC